MKHLKRWLAILVSVIALTATVLVIPANAAYVTHPIYLGARWYGKTVCVEDRTPSNGLRPAVKSAVYDWNANTNLAVWYKVGVGSCAGFSQRIYVVQKNYGANGMLGWPSFSYRWGTTPVGNYTYLFNSGMTVHLNTHYRNTMAGWDHVATHELGHAFGLNHVGSTCNSVMTNRKGCPWLIQTSANDRKWLNAIYAQ